MPAFQRVHHARTKLPELRAWCKHVQMRMRGPHLTPSDMWTGLYLIPSMCGRVCKQSHLQLYARGELYALESPTSSTYCLLLTAYCVLYADRRSLLTADCSLLTAYSLLLTYHLLTTYLLLTY